MNTSKSKALYEKATGLIPGGVNSPVRAFKSVGLDPIFIERQRAVEFMMWMVMNTSILSGHGVQ